MKIREWFKDKWAWLLTFNNPPEVIVTAEKIEFTNYQDTPFIEVQNRVKIHITVKEFIHKTKERASKV